MYIQHLYSSNLRLSHNNKRIMTVFWTIGCLYGGASVLLGAFGAHGLKGRIADPSKLANWSTAAQYQVCHRGSRTSP